MAELLRSTVRWSESDDIYERVRVACVLLEPLCPEGH